MDQTTFDLFQHTDYNNESAFASDPLSEKAWMSDDLGTFWESARDMFPDISLDDAKMVSTLKPIKEESQAIKEPRCIFATMIGDSSPMSKNLTAARSHMKGSYDDLKSLTLKSDVMNSSVTFDASCMPGEGCQLKKTALVESVTDAWESAADDLFKNEPDFGIIEIGRKFSLPCDETSWELLLDNYDDGIGSVESLTPVDEGDDVWDAADSLWHEPASINMETDNQILQLLAHVKDMGASMDELSVACNPASTDQQSLTTNSSDSALNSSADDDDDYDDNDLDVFDSLGDESGESFWTDMKPVIVSPTNETDDESEEVDIISVVEEVESPKEEVFTDSLLSDLSAKERQALDSLRRVTSDHCYCPLVVLDWLDAAQKPANSKTEKTFTSFKKCNLGHGDGLPRRPSMMQRRLPLKRGRRKLCELQAIPGGSRCKDSRRHAGRSSRFFPHSTREKREQLNQMERERRIGLKACFERLRVVVPETALNSKASKDKILLFARSKIRFLEQMSKSNNEELMRLKKMNDFLHQRLKRASSGLAN